MRLGVNISVVSNESMSAPYSLFAAGEQGVWLDPSDLSTMFQNAAGTTPVTAPAQPVGRILDKSGRGNNATQATAASRPTYGVVPSRGRVNLLTFTEQFDNAAWSKYNSGTGVAPVVTPNAAEAPDGTMTADQVVFSTGAGTTTSDFSLIGQTITTTAENHTASVWIRTLSGTATLVLRGAANAGFASITVTTQWQRFSRAELALSGAGEKITVGIRQGLGGIGTINASATVLIWGAQLETGTTATPYQRVVSQFEVTDPAGFPSYPLHYLSFDGVDDFLVTPTITPNADKVQVFAGVRKLSDANTAIVIEHSANYASNNGTLALFAPAVGTFPRYDFYTKGTSAAFAVTPSSYPAPITNVVTGLGDISGDIATLRVNGSLIQTVSSDQGTGNYLAYQMFIGRRGGTSLPFNGQLYGLITRFSTANLNASLISNTERWMGGKTGVTI